MFAPISAILSLLFFSSTLPNGIRLVELPAAGESVEIVAGYTAGGLKGLASSEAARQLAFAAYVTGGTIQFFDELDRTGFRIVAPRWALPMFTDGVASLFRDEGTNSGTGPRVAEVQATRGPVPEFRARVEDEIRNALLAPVAQALPYATDNAFVLIAAPSDALRQQLESIPRRAGNDKREEPPARLPAERTLRFKSDLPAGAVIFAAPIPGVFYRQWYLVLLLDRIIRRAVPLSLTTAMPLTVHPYYYRMELAVPSGQFPEPAEENLLQEILRLQLSRVNTQQLEAARQESLAYLDSKPVREWFASHDLVNRRDEGAEWVRAMTADDMRVAARDLLISNRVIATWAPRPKQAAVAVESLTSLNDGKVSDARSQPESPAATPSRAGPESMSPARFPPHPHAALPGPPAERIASGVFLVPSNVHAVFISGGSMTRYDREPDAAAMKAVQTYRPDRILVLVPPSSMDSARKAWNGFKGSDSRETGVAKGPVASGDLAALFVLQTLLEVKLIEAGWWNDAELRIDASEGSALQIRANAQQRSQILAWIKQIASEKPADDYFNWALEVAMHRFPAARADLQALTWERDVLGAVQDIATITAGHVQDVARIYF